MGNFVGHIASVEEQFSEGEQAGWGLKSKDMDKKSKKVVKLNFFLREGSTGPSQQDARSCGSIALIHYMAVADSTAFHTSVEDVLCQIQGVSVKTTARNLADDLVYGINRRCLTGLQLHQEEL